jgi:hypothetical protein
MLTCLYPFTYCGRRRGHGHRCHRHLHQRQHNIIGSIIAFQNLDRAMDSRVGEIPAANNNMLYIKDTNAFN